MVVVGISSQSSPSAPGPLTGEQTDDVRYVLPVVTYGDMLWQSSRIADLGDPVLTGRG